MKKLYLLRHAEAQVNSGEDMDRQLTEKGFADTKTLAEAMTVKNISCDIVLCSTALRARQTCDGVISSIAVETPVEYVKDLYYVDLKVMLKVLRQLKSNYESAFIVSHNPTLSELATYLIGGKDTKIHFNAGVLKYLELNIETWHSMISSCAKLIWSMPS